MRHLPRRESHVIYDDVQFQTGLARGGDCISDVIRGTWPLA